MFFKLDKRYCLQPRLNRKNKIGGSGINYTIPYHCFMSPNCYNIVTANMRQYRKSLTNKE